MFKFCYLIIQLIFLLVAFPAIATNVEQPTHSEPIIASLPNRTVDSSTILSDYSYSSFALEAIKKHIEFFTEKIKEKFSLWLSRSGKYIDMMKNILRENNIPEEMVFLPLIESGFNPNAYSRARAVGYWQFIASTAKRYGLEINWWKDERRDPEKSTWAAANYLKDLYEMFGSWDLAMAAYNAGEGKILKALNKTNTDNYWELVKTDYIKPETKNYVPKFIAAALIANNPDEYGFDNLEFHPSLEYDTVTITSPLDLDVIAQCAETSLIVIKELNPELRRWCTPPDVSEYTLRIPAGKKEAFIKNLEKFPENKRFSIDTYKVKKGDTFTKISKKTGIPIQVILDLNSLEKGIPLKTGMKIFLPPKDKFKMYLDDKKIVKKASYKHKSYKYIKKIKSKKRSI